VKNSIIAPKYLDILKVKEAAMAISHYHNYIFKVSRPFKFQEEKKKTS
jgi:hypothetical protein